MPAEPLRANAVNIDMSARFVQSSAIVGSPATNAETIVCQITVPANATIVTGVQLWGWVAFTVGTSGTGATLKLRQTNTSGSVINVGTGASTVAATNLIETGCQGLDAAGTLPNQVYVLTLQITGGAATSTVSAVQLVALVI